LTLNFNNAINESRNTKLNASFEIMNEVVYMTQEGLNNLKAELKDIIEVKKPENATRIKTARDLGDVSENAEYSIAREEQTKLDIRVQELESIIRRAKVVTGEAGAVSVGKKVKVHVEGEDEEFHIVGEPEADPLANKISHESPLGTLMVGKKVGDTFELEIPTGKLTYKILEIK
jgi:transcription elongation factor GreA